MGWFLVLVCSLDLLTNNPLKLSYCCSNSASMESNHSYSSQYSPSIASAVTLVKFLTRFRDIVLAKCILLLKGSLLCMEVVFKFGVLVLTKSLVEKNLYPHRIIPKDNCILSLLDLQLYINPHCAPGPTAITVQNTIV